MRSADALCVIFMNKRVFQIFFILLLAAFPVRLLAETSFVIPGRYIVKFQDSVNAKTQQRKYQKIKLLDFPAKNKRRKRYHRFYNECAKLKRQNSNIVACSPDFVIKTAASDPYIFNCDQAANCNWAVENVKDTDLDLQQAWEISEGSPNIIVAVLDTGVDLNHEDLAANIWVNPGEIPANSIDDDGNGYIDDIRGINVFDNSQPIDKNGHGTHVAGIIAAIRGNNFAIAGAAPKVKVLPIKILDDKGYGTIAGAIKGLEYLIDLAENRGIQIHVMNNSWGGLLPAGHESIAMLRDIFTSANEAGILSVAAAGNNGFNNDHYSYYPANLNLPNKIAVAATNFEGRIASFSNRGGNSVHIAAPGANIRSLLAAQAPLTFGTAREGGTVLASGTSMSAPYVSAAIALIAAHFPSLTHLEIKDRLLNRVYPLPVEDSGKTITSGRLNIYYALSEGDIPVPTPLPTLTPTVAPSSTPTPSFDTDDFESPNPAITAIPTSVFEPLDPDTKVMSPQLSIFPIQFLQKTQPENHISARHANLLIIESSEKYPIKDFKLRISRNRCLVREFALSGATQIRAILRLRRNARSLKKIRVQLTGPASDIHFDQNIQVKQRVKTRKRAVCKSLKRNIIVHGSN